MVLLFLLLNGCQREIYDLSITKGTSEQITFGLEQIASALNEQGVENEIIESKKAWISWKIQSTGDSLKPEGFALKKIDGRILIVGADEAGIMYGGLELAEQIRLFGWEGVKEVRQNPHMALRGTKFNFPLDMRTPSYTDASDAGQKNIATMWDFAFWKEYLDQLAQYRFNHVSLWNLHPFPSMVKLEDYPDIALDDIHRSTTEWKEYYHLHGTGLDAPEILKDPEILKRLTIDEKIAFWQKVMAYARTRNIRFSIITWNVFTNGTAGKYGITNDLENETTRDYFRSSIKALFRTYPDLAGIGLTTGENMHGKTFEEKEDWAYDTYARAVLELAREMPDRKFTFNHRQHQAGAAEIIKKFKPLIDQPNIDFMFSFKYAQAHVYSAVKPSYHDDFVKNIGDLKTVFELRNDDTYFFRWGAPEFVRQFIQNMPTDVMKGMYFGSDQWIWGRDFLTKNPASNPSQLEVVKHWYQWMLWGRLAYNPGINNDRFKAIIQHKYPAVEADALFDAWQHASLIYPITTGFHWGALDFQWYIEGCKSRPAQAENETGFHDVNRFISLPPHPESGYQSIPEFVQMLTNGGSSELKTPIEVAQMLHEESDRALQLIASMETDGTSELASTVQDIRTISLMGKYYAFKIAGSAYLALYRETGEKKYQEKAVNQLSEALRYWKRYTQSALENNKNPLWTNRVGYVDFQEITEWVANDLVIAKVSNKGF
ncbi:MAG: carbohydrate-binding family 6 protein [Cyclobacteriaceae bacterium]